MKNAANFIITIVAIITALVIGKGILITGSNDVKNFINNNGGRDYFGNSVSNSEKPNIGAYNGS